MCSAPTPDPGHCDPSLRLDGLFDAKKMVLLSFFDGVGTAPYVLEQMIGKPKLAFSWEIDPECLAIATSRVPWVMQRGDVFEDNMQSIAQTILEQDPGKEMLILVATAPPCHDYSRIKADAEGRHGPEGSKFVRFVEQLSTLEASLPDHRFELLAENVIMSDDSDVQHFSKALNATAVVVDSADRGAVSRPRLWWTRVNWAKARKNPYTGEPLRWTQQNQHRRLKMGLPPLNLHSLDYRGYSLDEAVLAGHKRVPCFTTPAPDNTGRPEPAHARGRVAAESKQRWLQDNRQFAPWQYAQHAMALYGNDLVNMPAHLKEQLHEYPADFTKHAQVTDKGRHRLLANSWHVRVAAFMFALILQTVGAGSTSVPVPSSPAMSAIQTVLQLGHKILAQPLARATMVCAYGIFYGRALEVVC